jgi:hypothetical protein
VTKISHKAEHPSLVGASIGAPKNNENLSQILKAISEKQINVKVEFINENLIYVISSEDSSQNSNQPIELYGTKEAIKDFLLKVCDMQSREQQKQQDKQTVSDIKFVGEDEYNQFNQNEISGSLRLRFIPNRFMPKRIDPSFVGMDDIAKLTITSGDSIDVRSILSEVLK